MLNRRVASEHPGTALRGHRAPDAALVTPGAAFPRRLYELTPYSGRFWILVIAGALESAPFGAKLSASCVARHRTLKAALDEPDSLLHTHDPVFAFLTIPMGKGAFQSAEALGEQALGFCAYDVTGDAYAKYQVEPGEGALVVVRPGGIVGITAPLGKAAYSELRAYFDVIVRSLGSRDQGAAADLQLTVGEISLERQEERILVTDTSAKQ